MPKKNGKIIKILTEFKEKASRKYEIKKFILFGSRATGKAKKNSDVDMLIISKDFEGKKSFERSPDLYIMWDYDYDADIFCLTPAEFAIKKRQISVIREAVRDGIEI